MCDLVSGDPLVALDLAPMHDAPRFRVERVPPMQHGEIIPHQKITNLPFMAHHKARLRGMGPERIEQGLALDYLKAEHISIRPPAEKQRLASGFRIGANQRMVRARGLPNVGDFLVALAQHTRAVTRSVVHRGFTLDGLLHVRRQGLISLKHIREIGVTARFRRRHLQRMQNRRLWRQVDVSHVGMPDRFAVTEIAYRLAVLDYVGDDVEFRVRLVECFAVRVWPGRIELSEALAEGNELWIRQTLPMED